MKRQELFPVLLIAACVLACGLVGNGLYSCLRERQAGIPAEVIGLRLAFAFFLLLCACFLYKVRLREYDARPMLWSGVFLAAILAGAGADSLQTLLESLIRREAVRVPLDVVIYTIAFFGVLLGVRSGFANIPPRSLKTEDPEGRSHLILFLSNLDLRAFPDGVPAGLTGNLAEDLSSLAAEKRAAKSEGKRAKLWAWEQSLRAIDHHFRKRTLLTVTVFASEESVKQVPLFAGLISAYPELMQIEFKLFLKPGDREACLVNIKNHTLSLGGWCFEDFTDLSQGVHNLLRLLKKSDSDIIIDFTGGQKVTSVVAAAMTFNRAMKAQYVQTEDPWKVLSYRVVTSSEMGPGT